MQPYLLQGSLRCLRQRLSNSWKNGTKIWRLWRHLCWRGGSLSDCQRRSLVSTKHCWSIFCMHGMRKDIYCSNVIFLQVIFTLKIVTSSCAVTGCLWNRQMRMGMKAMSMQNWKGNRPSKMTISALCISGKGETLAIWDGLRSLSGEQIFSSYLYIPVNCVDHHFESVHLVKFAVFRRNLRHCLGINLRWFVLTNSKKT